MPSKIWSAGCVAILAVVAALFCASFVLGDTEPADVVRNGDFESSAESKDEPAVWRATRVPHTIEQVTFGWDDQVFHSGSRSASISIDEAHPDDQIHYNWNQHVFGFNPGASYQVTAWIKTRNLTKSAFVVVQCWNQAITEVIGSTTNQNVDEVHGTSDWVRIQTTLEVPEATKRMVVLAGIAVPQNRGGKAWFDDIQIIPIVRDK